MQLSPVCSKKYRTTRVKGNSKENFERERERASRRHKKFKRS